MKNFIISRYDFFKNLSLQKKIVSTYFLLIVFPLTLVAFFAYNISATSVKLEVSRYISEVLQQVNDNIDNNVSEIDRMSSILSSDKDVLRILQEDKDRALKQAYQDEEDMDEKINNLINFRSGIEGFFVFSYNGEIYSYKGSGDSIRLDYNFTRTRWYETIKTLGLKKLLLPTHIQDQVLTARERKTVFSLARTIVDINTSKPVGNVLIDVDTSVIAKVWGKLNIRQYQDFLIVDNNKTIIYHTNEDMISSQFRSDYISKLLKSKNGNIITDVNGKAALVSFNTSPQTNWTVISIIPISILYKNITKLQYVIILIVTLCLIFSLLIAIIISRSITKPISELRKSMKIVELGKFNVEIPVKSKDEIGELSLSFNKMINELNKLIQTVYETKILKKEAELNALQSQINPHFLYNTLQTIDMLAESEGIDVISSICQSLSRIFRYSINRGKEIVPLSREIEHAKDYIYLQKLRFGDKFEVQFDIDKELFNNKMIKLVLQPLVENALYHGIEHKTVKCLLKVTAKKVGDSINICVQDTGKGMDKYQLEKLVNTINEEILHAEVDGLVQRSIGIKNVNARIRLYFGENYGVSIESKLNEGTIITVNIPIIPHDNGGFEHGA